MKIEKSKPRRGGVELVSEYVYKFPPNNSRRKERRRGCSNSKAPYTRRFSHYTWLLSRFISSQPPHTKLLVVKLQSCTDEELISTLETITVWKYGKVRRDSKCSVRGSHV